MQNSGSVEKWNSKNQSFLLQVVSFSSADCNMLNNKPTVEECDATGFYSSNADGFIKILHCQMLLLSIRREIFNCSDIYETIIFVFAQLFWRYTRILLNFFDEMILVGEILFGKKFAFADVFKRRS